MQQAPPQFSPDGLYWWDGVRWMPRTAEALNTYAPPPLLPIPAAAAPAPTPGLRIVLLVFLALMTAGTGVLALAFTVTVFSGDFGPLDLALGAAVIYMFGLSIGAIVGVSMRTVWSRWVAIACGILACWTIVGIVLGIPILVTAARAPDLKR